jgi:FMN phosphatase YigB (HAD superfamily)
MENSDIKAVLFDLDGTLLGNNLDVFLPRYFEAISAHVASILPPRQFIAHLLRATQVMMANDGRATNEEVFASVFYPLIGRPREEMEPVFTDFYLHAYPILQQYTQCLPEARQAVQAAFERGLDLVIATNPLFPALAVQERLEWAGVGDFRYRLVTSYENSRWCKPNPSYYRQILETIGREPASALVVGNEAGDMVSAQIGCQTFLVPGAATALDPALPAPNYRGTLGDLVGLLRQ